MIWTWTIEGERNRYGSGASRSEVKKEGTVPGDTPEEALLRLAEYMSPSDWEIFDSESRMVVTLDPYEADEDDEVSPRSR